MLQLPEALAAFAAYRQFCIYRTEPSASRPGKTDKFPCSLDGLWPVNAHDPSIWMDADTALSVAATWGAPYGVGFVFTESDPFWFLDIDNCLLPEGTWSPVAQQLCQHLAGAAVEVSQSGKGLHIFGTGDCPPHRCKNDSYGLELYTSGRFVALTGQGAIGNCAAYMNGHLTSLVAAYFPPDATSGGFSGPIDQEWAWAIERGADEEWNGPTDDEELIRRAMASHSAASTFGERASFSDLWLADEAALSRAYPDSGGRPYDCNRADSALAQHLAFWTGKDCERIRRLMERSGLVRDKWEREDYLPRTILAVVGRQVEVLADKPVVLPPSPGEPYIAGATMVDGSTYLNAELQMELFKNCVYIRDQHKVLVGGGVTLRPDQFKVHFGGYTFAIDNEAKRVSRDPWEAFTQSQLFRCRKVEGTCFRPELAPGVIIERGGTTLVNSYFPVEVPRKAGNPTPFLEHMAKLLPDARDREIFLSYLAACVQYKGVKFQWAPVLQGVEGNGKTLFTRCVAEAIGRRYVHWPKASKLAKDFNSWMVGKLLYCVEDIYVPNERREVLEELKPMITGENLEIEGKGVDQISGDICGNFLFNTNLKDAVRKTRNDRRYAIFYTAQQKSEDFKRDGMDGDYFPRLYNWLKEEGYAIVTDLLNTYEIPDEFNPATQSQRAPATSSSEDVFRATMGPVEQEVLEAIENELVGFRGGFISSFWLERLLERLGCLRKISPIKREDMLASLGYRIHPALRGGRCTNNVVPDGCKPKLFVLDGCQARLITFPPDVVTAYEQANTAFTK